MTVRSEIFNLIDLGPLPSEAGSVTDVARRQTLIQSIAPPLTLAEATALAGVLGPDNCFGLAWTVVHLIESAPGWSVEHVPSGSRSEEHTSELQSLMRISYAVFCLKKNKVITMNTPAHRI